MQLLPVRTRKMHWTRGLKQICQLLEHHHDKRIVCDATNMPFIVAGSAEVDMKHESKINKSSHCSLPGCEKNDSQLKKQFQVCTRCKVAKYCSRKHQREHWKVHKRECKKHHLKKEF